MNDRGAIRILRHHAAVLAFQSRRRARARLAELAAAEGRGFETRGIGVPVLAALCCGLVVCVSFPAALSLAIVGWQLARFQRSRAASRARRNAERSMPLILDLLGVWLAVGATPGAALAATAVLVPPNEADWVRSALAANRAGLRVADAIDLAAAEEPPLVRRAAGTVAGAVRSGADVVRACTETAAAVRIALHHRHSERIRRTGVLLLGPLVVCILPAVVLGTVVPILGATFR
jgi:Flp pilus assembly protein TadB